MASRILLISTNTCTMPDPVFPLGMAHVAAALRRAGHQVSWLDMLASSEPLPAALKRAAPDFVGISLRNIDDVLIRKQEIFFGALPELCASIRAQANARIILGGSGFSIFPRELLQFSTADYGIQGEGEQALPELINALENQQELSGIAGLVYRTGGKLTCNPRASMGGRCAENTLGESILPEGEALSFYVQSGGMLNVQTQRGCAHHCCYCTYPVIEGQGHRRRPADQVAAEFERASAAGVQYLFIVDSIFNSTPEHVYQVCEAIIARGVRVRWGCFLRPQGLTPELMRLMVKAGLSHIEFGSDSFSDTVLSAYKKRLTFEDISQSSRLAHDAGVDYCHFLICGGPGETLETLEESFRHSRELPGAVIMAVVGMRIYPGTELCKRAIKEGLIKDGMDLLQPCYYLAPGLESRKVFEMLNDFGKANSNWIAGDPSPEYARVVQRLRQRGVVGPLWSYLSMIQRLWPQGVAATATSGASTAHGPSL